MYIHRRSGQVARQAFRAPSQGLEKTAAAGS